MLKAKKPKDIPKRLKLLLYGPAGVGKTMATIQMPCPYVIDCEKGTDYYGDMIEEKGGVVFQTTQMVEVIGEVKSLICEEHEHRTLVIDPITTAYQDLLDQCEKEVGNQ
ncbi:MAG: ATP-binding protein, partial [Phycisphaerae bacterium]|nr:ATP-binding protein [Phycisphaerae bacterium]